MKNQKLETVLGKITEVIANQRHLNSIKDAFMMTIPLTLIGSISLLISSPPISNTTNSFLLAIKDFATANPILKVPYSLTTGIYGLWIVLAISYCHAKSMKVNQLSSMIIAGVSFLCVAGITADNTIPIPNIGSKGIFAGMIIAILTVEIFALFLRKNIRIKLPDTVPPNIGASFDAIIAFGFILVLFMGIDKGLTSITGFGMITAMVELFKPLVLSSDTLMALIVAVFLQRLLWFFGIHGGSVTNAILNPILMANLVANQEAFEAGKEIPYTFVLPVYGGSFWGLSFLAAAIVMAFMCKSTHLKTVGKLGLFPALCGIGEPINFGTPFVLNIKLMIPGILQFVLNCSIAYLAIDLGFINKCVVAPPLGTPTFLAVFLASMDYRAIILWVMLLVMNIAMYIPFMKSYDKDMVEVERLYEESKKLEV